MSTGVAFGKPAVEYLRCFFYRVGSFTDNSQFRSELLRAPQGADAATPLAGIPSRSERIARVSRVFSFSLCHSRLRSPPTPSHPNPHHLHTHTHTKWWLWVVWKI